MLECYPSISAFDSVPHDLLFEKVKKLLINPYVVNWLISFLENRIQRVMVDGITTEYLYINRGVLKAPF